MASTLGVKNPLRYRGYVYDAEIGWYYLKSRYYNPVWGKFLNADSMMGRNLYSYCYNAPTLMCDIDGMYPGYRGVGNPYKKRR